ncbi:flagellar brake protein [Oxalobacter sp. OttesenSCG-928-P03]|nr:flagellar brake protein [Oxalobacter sp. OttesenSCG-928-P03]
MSANNTADNQGRSFEENLEKYQVFSPLEIGRILRGIQANKQLIRMSFAGTMETVITSVLDVDVKARMLMLDSSPVQAQNEVAIRSNMISFEGVLDRIKISFTTNRVYADTFEGRPSLRVPFPERLVRLQRRDHFRVPVSNSTIRIPMEVNGHVMHSVGNIRDLSPNGACVIDASMMLDNTVGMVYPNCRLDLPDTQPLNVTLEIRNSHEISMPDTSHQRRIGCQFVNLSSAESALIQRYITRLERQQKMLTG